MEVKGYMNTMKCQKSIEAKVLIWNESYKKIHGFEFSLFLCSFQAFNIQNLKWLRWNYSFVHAFFSNYNGLAFFW